MSDEVQEEPTTNDSEEDAIEELTIEERQEALKRARWNVFMYLGLAALLFGFALYPFMSTTMDVDEGADMLICKPRQSFNANDWLWRNTDSWN